MREEMNYGKEYHFNSHTREGVTHINTCIIKYRLQFQLTHP